MKKNILSLLLFGLFMILLSSFASAQITLEALVVAGGGGGGQNTTGNGGGGGAGGLLYDGSYPLSGGTYTVTIGGGGATATSASGGNSVFNNITAIGGGGGGYYNLQPPKVGGSGGGGGQTADSGAGGTVGQGNAGGDSVGNGYGGGGGGGAGAIGDNSFGTNGREGGDGGAGLSYSISGSATDYAGGGGGSSHSSATAGGSAGGTGGGGAGQYGGTPGVAGTANTGGGGGGGGQNQNGGDGGSGIVIISYLIADASGYNITGGTEDSNASHTFHTFLTSADFIIEAVVTSNAPNIIAPNNVTLEYNVDVLSVDFNATNTSAIDTWWINETTDFSIDSATGVLSNTTSMSVREWHINVSINNTDGDINSTIYSVNVTNTPPTTQLYLPIDNYNTSFSHINLSGWVNDTNSDTLTAYFQVEGVIVDTQTSLSDGDAISYNYTSLSEGANLWTVIVYDGIVNATVENRTVNLDTEGPHISLTDPVNHTHLSGIMSITTDITDDTTGISSAYYNISNSTHLIVSNQALTSGGSWDSTFDTTTTGDDNCTISIFANDTLGNINITESTFYIDSALPSVTWIAPLTNLTTTNPIYPFNVSVYHPYLDLVNVTIFNLSNDIRYTNESASGLSVSTYNFTDIVNLSALSGDGDYTIEVCGRSSLTDSPDIISLFDSTDTKTNITIGDVKTERDLGLIDDKDVIVEDVSLYKLTREDTSDGKHIKSIYTTEGLKDGMKYYEDYKTEKGWIITNNRGIPRIIDKDYKIFTRFDDLTKEGYIVELNYLYPKDTRVVRAVWYKPTYKSIDIADPISGGLQTLCENKTIELDSTGPVCTMLSVTPSDIEANSTGIFEMIVNCTDINGVNTTKVGEHYYSFFTMTVDDNGSLPNYWSIFYPSNNLAVAVGPFGEQISRASGRNKSYWYEEIVQTELSNIYDYAVYDGIYGHFKIQSSGPTWATFNISGPLESLVFKSAFPLNKEAMFAEEKKEYLVNANDGMMVLFHDLERRKGSINYTLIPFGNFNYTGVPNKDMLIYYCNQSYLDVTCGGDFTTGCTVPPQYNLDYCVYLNSLPTEALDTRQFTEENSSYVRDVYGIIDEMIGGIHTTNISYIYYRSQSNSGSFTLRYANGASGTNVSFANSGLAFSSTDDGQTFSSFAGTIDAHIDTIKDGDQFQLGGCNWDLLGNEFCDYTFYTDDIGDVNFPIGSPSINAYQNFLNTNNSYHEEEDENLNGNYSDNMTIHILTAIDPDAIGAVNHSLYLYNSDGTLNSTINNSFYSIDDSDLHIYFDTNIVADGLYKMNITAIADDDITDVTSRLTYENFTIDNTPPTIISPANKTLECGILLNVDFNATDLLSTIDTSSWDSNNTNFSINSNGILSTSITLPLGYYIIEVSVNDSLANKQTVEYNLTIIDATSPTSNSPSDATHSLDSIATIGWNITEVNPAKYYVLRNGSEQNASEDYVSNIIENVWVNTTTVGTWNYTIFFNDSSGNEGYDEVIITVVTNSAPAITINNPPNNVVTEESSETFNITVTDDDNDNMTIYYFFDGILINYSNSSISNGTEYTYTHTGIAEGSHTWNVTVDDGTDNTSYERVWTRDLTAPTITLNNISDNYNSTGTEITFNWTATDNLMTNLMCNITLDSVVNISNIASTNATAVTQKVTGLVDGTHTWSVTCSDNTSNSQTSSTRTFIIDNRAPRICGGLYFGASYGTNFEMSCSGSDSGVGIDTWAINDSTDNFSITQSGFVSNASALGLGLWHLNISVNDTLGNENSTVWIINITDTNVPALDIEYPLDTYYQNLTHINLSIRDDFPSYITINDTRWNLTFSNTSFSSYENITDTQAEGNYSILINWNDTSNNVGTYILNYTIDRTAPVVFLVAPDNNSNWTTSSTVTLTYNVTDSNPIASCYYDMSSVSGSDRGGNDLSITQNINQTFSNTFTNADYTWYINCTDEAGNVNQSAFYNLTVLYVATSDDEAAAESTRGSGKQAVSSSGGFGKKFASGCMTEPPFINRVLRGCSIENNSVCEDGENLLIDNDCKPYRDDLKSGKIFTYMWFVRLMLLFSLIMFLRKDPNFPVIVFFIILLLAANGAFGNLSLPFMDSDDNSTMINGTNINETKKQAEANITKPNLLKEDFKDFGGLVMPNHPYLGGIALIILFYIFIILIPSRWGKKK